MGRGTPALPLGIGSDDLGCKRPVDLSNDKGVSKRRQLLTGEELNTQHPDFVAPLEPVIGEDATRPLHLPLEEASSVSARNNMPGSDRLACDESSDDGDGKHLFNGGQRRERIMRRNDLRWPVFPSSSSLCCGTCNAMTGTRAGLRALRSPRGYKHLNWYDLQESASRECALCGDIWDMAEQSNWDYEADGSVVRDEIRITGNFGEDGSVRAGISRGHPIEGMLLDGIQVLIPAEWESYGEPYEKAEEWHMVTFAADPISSIVPGRRECTDLTQEAAAEIRRWLAQCQDVHESCPRRRDRTLPRRVINVESPTPCLYHSDPDEEAEYAALSYCWGGVSQPTTTRANLQDHLQSIHPARLPKTVTDAIELCRAIGVRYLWVDALCIVQDDEKDKLNQVANMGTIYKNSTLTIIVASAEKVTNGFLGRRKHNEYTPHVELPIFVDEATTGTVYLRQKHSGETYSAEEPYFQRGWTYQEMLLSPQAVVFDSTQITLKCLTDYYRPIFKTYLSTKVDAPELPVEVFGMVSYHMRTKSLQAKNDYYIPHMQHEIWSTILHDYSERDLTRFGDRLPALAGIATELSKVWDNKYLAGLWARTISQHLGWYLADRKWRDRDRRPSGELFGSLVDRKRRSGRPTWSWITAPYPVQLYSLKKAELELVDSDVTLESQRSPFGNVKSASVTFRGTLLDIAAAMGPNVELEVATGRQTSYGRGKIWLDFEEPKPCISICRLLFLGHTEYDGGAFLVVERKGGNRYERVGITALPNPRLWSEEPCVWKEQLQASESEIIVLE